MAFDKDAMVEQLSGLTVLELVDLVEALKEKWGVEASAAMPAGMMMPQGGAPAAEEAAEEQTEFTVTITSAGDKKLQVIKEVRGITQLGLKEAKEPLESGGTATEDVRKDAADEIKQKLEAAGASVEVK
jgi:large subunit ribosomal protein L7/L12